MKQQHFSNRSLIRAAEYHRNMFDARILLILSLSVSTGGRAFMIHNIQSSLCLEDSVAGEVLLAKCNLDSEFQQWVWIDQGMLKCIGSTRCLSAQQTEPIQTQPCQGSTVGAASLMWDCDRARLISRNTSMLLSVDGQRLILAHVSKNTKWKSLEAGDICQEKLRVRRHYNEPDEFEVADGLSGKQAGLTEEQKEYFRWYYRSEDSTTWTFVLLGLSFVCLLVGFLLLGMGAAANKSRKKIAKYKAAASLAQRGEREMLRIMSPLTNDSCSKPPASPSGYTELQGNHFSTCDRDANELRAGNIVVTWKDGNTSFLYSDPEVQEETKGEDEEKEVEKEGEQEEGSAAERRSVME
ncbi:hypothetical protein Q5P01_006084 [Channa striata]|uniref:Ricin B lectin domain-containing protein n=1 Tax=Channa striata TaxID=64152 RepID=A0AA88NCF3_CHASR|nr:hypothetical protein Q5P01_006084 [Channa striata]